MIMYKRGKMGHRYMIPLLTLKKEEAQLLTRRKIQGLSIQEEIHKMKLGSKPSL